MFSVKKVTKHEYKHLLVEAGVMKYSISHGRGWAVVDENDMPVCHKNEYNGKITFDVFDRKATAQQQADWMNRNSAEVELLPVEKHEW